MLFLGIGSFTAFEWKILMVFRIGVDTIKENRLNNVQWKTSWYYIKPTLSILFEFLQDLQRLVEILRLTHELLSEHVAIDPFNLMMGEISETISLVSFSGRMASQVRLC